MTSAADSRASPNPSSPAPFEFQQTMGCTAREFVSWLPAALPGASLETNENAGRCIATFGQGTLTLAWSASSALRIGQLQLPRLLVNFTFEGMSEIQRNTVQQRFNRATHRGGG
jgi:hypothetical protein